MATLERLHRHPDIFQARQTPHEVWQGVGALP